MSWERHLDSGIETSNGALIGVATALSLFSGDKSATTTVTGQSEKFASAATGLTVVNMDSTNYARIGFGNSNAESEANISSGIVVMPGKSINTQKGRFTHYAWLGDTGTVLLHITQAV